MDNAIRPYLVIPKLIEQPTWGGEYIASTKGWRERPELSGRKIGQSYELFSGSNLSFCTSSDDPDFVGELANRDTAQVASSVPRSVPLRALIGTSPDMVLGPAVASQRGTALNLLIKFTQALGNSFQVHPRGDENDARWRPKAESWYYFESGLLTLGVRQDTNWQDYEIAVQAVEAGMRDIGERIQSGQTTFEAVQPEIRTLLERYDPWQFVNRVGVAQGDVIDLSAGGIHHSWEEDTVRLPLGNVLYEVQTEAMDDVSTLRCFDRGKIGTDGSLREVHISDYFRFIDRSPEANDPQTHMRQPVGRGKGETWELVQLLDTKYYHLDRLTMATEGAAYIEKITQFCHLFVKSGRVTVATDTGKVIIGSGHSCFVPAGVGEYAVQCESAGAEVLISW